MPEHDPDTSATGDAEAAAAAESAAAEAESADAAPAAAAPADPSSAEATRPRARVFAAAVLGVVAVVLLHTAILGGWTIRTATDTEWFEGQIEEILRSEEVSAALAEVVLDEVTEQLDLRGELVAIAPDSVDPLIDVLLAGLEARLEDRLAELIREPAVAETVAAIAGRAHALAIDVLEGESLVDVATVDDGQVRLNLVPLAARAIGLLPDVGVLGDVEVPRFEAGGDPAEQVAELEAALGIDLADDFAQPTIFTSDTLDRAGDTVDTARSVLLLAKRGFWFLVVAGLLAAAASLYLSRRRLRTAVFLTAGVVVSSLLTRATVGTIADRVPDAVAEPGARATVREVVNGLRVDLNRTLLVSSLLALVALGVAVYAVLRPRNDTVTSPTVGSPES